MHKQTLKPKLFNILPYGFWHFIQFLGISYNTGFGTLPVTRATYKCHATEMLLEVYK
jgi:hypothetical protein